MARYEAFIRMEPRKPTGQNGILGITRLLGSERFIKKMVKEKTPLPVSRRLSLENLLQKVASRSGLDPHSLKRNERMAKLVEARDCFICEAVLEEGYLASELADFLGCHPSNVGRAVQKG